MYIFFDKKIHPQLTNKLAHLYDQGEQGWTPLQSLGVSHWVHNLHICVNLHRIRSRERTLFLLPGSPLVRNQKTSSLKKSKEGQAKCATVITPELSKTNWTNWFKEKKTVRSRWGSTKQAPLASLNQWEASILQVGPIRARETTRRRSPEYPRLPWSLPPPETRPSPCPPPASEKRTWRTIFVAQYFWDNSIVFNISSFSLKLLQSNQWKFHYLILNFWSPHPHIFKIKPISSEAIMPKQYISNNLHFWEVVNLQKVYIDILLLNPVQVPRRSGLPVIPLLWTSTGSSFGMSPGIFQFSFWILGRKKISID